MFFHVLLVMPAPCLLTSPCIRFCNGPLYQNWIIQWLLVYPCQDPLLYTIASEYKSHCTGEAYMVLLLTISGSHCLTESIISESNTGAQVWQYLQRTKRHVGSSFAATSMPIREMDGHTYFETNNICKCRTMYL